MSLHSREEIKKLNDAAMSKNGKMGEQEAALKILSGIGYSNQSLRIMMGMEDRD